MMSPNFINHAYIHFNERKIVVEDDCGYQESVQFEWNEDGAEGFATISAFLQERLDSEDRTYIFN